MEREIRFRGRRADGKWLYGDLMFDKGRVCIADETVIESRGLTDIDDFTVDADSIGQYIGREDKSGNSIYSGQVLAFNVKGRLLKGVVEYSTPIAGYCVNIICDGEPTGVFMTVPAECYIIADQMP